MDAEPHPHTPKRGLAAAYAPLVGLWRGSDPTKRTLFLLVFLAVYALMAVQVGSALQRRRQLDDAGVVVDGWVESRRYEGRPGRNIMRVGFEIDGELHHTETLAAPLADFGVEGCWDGEGHSYPPPALGAEARAAKAQEICRESAETYNPFRVRVRYLAGDPSIARIEGLDYLGFGWFPWFVLALPFLLLVLTPPFHKWNTSGFEEEDGLDQA